METTGVQVHVSRRRYEEGSVMMSCLEEERFAGDLMINFKSVALNLCLLGPLLNVQKPRLRP